MTLRQHSRRRTSSIHGMGANDTNVVTGKRESYEGRGSFGRIALILMRGIDAIRYLNHAVAVWWALNPHVPTPAHAPLPECSERVQAVSYEAALQ